MQRWTAWMTQAGCHCGYGYGGHQILRQESPRGMKELMQHIMPLGDIHEASTWPNSCNLNLYMNETHSVGWHADNESMFGGADSPIRIISLSLGAPRTFMLREAANTRGRPSEVEVQLHDGDCSSARSSPPVFPTHDTQRRHQGA